MLRRHSRATASLGLILGLSALLGSCAPRLGWGLVLWTAADGSLPAGSIVPVYIKSNIEKLYVVGVPNATGKEKGKKVELQLWQLELYPTRARAAARAKAMGENVSLYMVATRDGNYIRDTPDNVNGKRVFRLREGQSVKILEGVDGAAVTTGGQALPGSWYRVLADEGTEGYAFSYYFKIYDEAKEGPPVIASAQKAVSGRVDLVFSRSWRPEYFQEMIDDNRIDLDYFNLRYGLFTDAINRQVRLELPAASQVFSYTAISEAKGLYVFEGTALKIRIESDSRMTCYWGARPPDDTATPDDSGDAAAANAAPPDQQAAVPESASSAGTGGSATLIVLASDAREAIRLETLRRQQLLSAFVDDVGGAWSAQGAGKLEIGKNGRFSWTGRGDASDALLPAGDGGEVALRAFLDPSLASSWSGVVSFRFDQAPGSPRPQWVDFLYRRTPAGLVLARCSAQGLVAQAPDASYESLILEPAQ